MHHSESRSTAPWGPGGLKAAQRGGPPAGHPVLWGRSRAIGRGGRCGALEKALGRGLSARRKPPGSAEGGEQPRSEGVSISQGTKRNRIQYECMRGIFFTRCLNKGQLLLWASCEIKCHSLVNLCTWS